MGASSIMIIRHAEKPDAYFGQTYLGVNPLATQCGAAGQEDLVTLGWERTGALVTLFAPPWGPKPSLSLPNALYAADPSSKDDSDAAADSDSTKGSNPSQRPLETLTALAAALNTVANPISINTTFSKKHYDKMVTDALQSQGAVLIAWQHEDIPAMGQSILTQTNTPPGSIASPAQWPGSRYDLVWVFNRTNGAGPIVNFSIFAQMLLAGDGPAPPIA